MGLKSVLQRFRGSDLRLVDLFYLIEDSAQLAGGFTTVAAHL